MTEKLDHPLLGGEAETPAEVKRKRPWVKPVLLCETVNSRTGVRPPTSGGGGGTNPAKSRNHTEVSHFGPPS